MTKIRLITDKEAEFSLHILVQWGKFGNPLLCVCVCTSIVQGRSHFKTQRGSNEYRRKNLELVVGGSGKEWPAFPIVIHEHCQNRMKQGLTIKATPKESIINTIWGIMNDFIQEMVFEVYPERWVEFQKETVQGLQSKGVWSMLSEKRNVQFMQDVENMDGSSWQAWLKSQCGARLGDQGIGLCKWLLFTLFSCWNFSALMHVQSLQLCLTLWDPNNCSSLGLSVHRILQERILE